MALCRTTNFVATTRDFCAEALDFGVDAVVISTRELNEQGVVLSCESSVTKFGSLGLDCGQSAY